MHTIYYVLVTILLYQYWLTALSTVNLTVKLALLMYVVKPLTMLFTREESIVCVSYTHQYSK